MTELDELRQAIAALEAKSTSAGISAGMVAAGGFSKAEDTVMGLPVNLGAHLEQAAPPGGLLISHDTCQHVRGAFEVESLAPIAVTGFSEPVPAHLVTCASVAWEHEKR